MTTAAVLPIKQLQNAKQRLASVLSPEERGLLFSAMVADVLTSVEACTQIDQIIVVTDDEAVAKLARGFGADVRPEPTPPGLIESVTETGRQLAAEGVRCMLFLPGDVPLVSADELDAVLAGFGSSKGQEFLIVPADDLGGSNCVACSPPDCMTFAFGEDSFRKHLAIARSRDISPQIMKLPGIGLDIDTPDDLRILMAKMLEDAQNGREYSTVRVLLEHGIAERLDESNAGIA